MPKTIGVLGGMGSYATHHFFGKLLEYSEPDEFRIIIDNNVGIPSRTLAVKGEGDNPQPGILRAIDDLHLHDADFVVVPCNSAHFWYRQDVIDIPWLNMIEVVSNAVKAKGYERPLILGGYVTVEKKLYSKYLPGAVYLSKDYQNDVEKIIKRIKKDDIRLDDIRKIEGIIKDKRLKKFDCVLYACTELSMLALQVWDSWEEVSSYPYDLIDSASEYAKVTVEYARGK